jgi:hypothetical protein
MMLSAYERRGEAKLFDDQEQIRSYARPSKPVFSPSTGTTYTSKKLNFSSPEVVMQPNFELSDSLIRIGIRGVSKGLRKILPRFVPYLGWAVTAKDIYDFATD